MKYVKKNTTFRIKIPKKEPRIENSNVKKVNKKGRKIICIITSLRSTCSYLKPRKITLKKSNISLKTNAKLNITWY